MNGSAVASGGGGVAVSELAGVEVSPPILTYKNSPTCIPAIRCGGGGGEELDIAHRGYRDNGQNNRQPDNSVHHLPGPPAPG